jgi:6-pyruvoyltetrahydropterin/6-carboxytetrahydropterin synthase
MDARRWPWGHDSQRKSQPNPLLVTQQVSRIPSQMMVRLSKSFQFEAAHDLPTFPDGNKCRRLHGHSFRFDVVVEGEVPPEKGYLIDYGEIKRVVDPIVRRLDHFYLNEIAGLENPTSEVIAKWIWDQIHPVLPMLAVLILHETCTSTCEYRGK